MSIEAKLAVGPMSSEIIEAAFRYNHPLMLIASKNQIDWSKGYVNNWTTKRFSEFVSEIKQKHPTSKVLICRDHCGPGFTGNHDLSDSYHTVEEDIRNGFDLIHFDLCYHPEGERLLETRKLIEHALSLNPNLMIEIGTDENTGDASFQSDELVTEIEYFLSFCQPEFYVVQTGSLVKEINQVGYFDTESVAHASSILHQFNLKMKEHNADYLDREQIKLRTGKVDAMNIAPQLGVVQTLYILYQAACYGIDTQPFLERCYRSGKWQKWLHNNTSNNHLLCSVIAGHYNYQTEEYVNVFRKLAERTDIKEGIIQEITKIFDHYTGGMDENCQ